MDFADATLVYLAGLETLSTVFTVDQADFETYQIDGRRRFRSSRLRALTAPAVPPPCIPRTGYTGAP
jgi:hypothetical protein